MTNIRRRSSDYRRPRLHPMVCLLLLLVYLAGISYGASLLLDWVAAGVWA